MLLPPQHIYQQRIGRHSGVPGLCASLTPALKPLVAADSKHLQLVAQDQMGALVQARVLAAARALHRQVPEKRCGFRRVQKDTCM